MRYLMLIMVITVLTNASHAQVNFSINAIDPVLMEKANTVVRLSETSYEIRNSGSYSEYNHFAYTILNPAGNPHANLVVNYDQFSSVKSISGTLYDAMGKKIRNLRKNEIKDVSGTSESSLADDNRVKYVEFEYSQYPYTVEFEYEISYDGMFNFPAWTPQCAENLSVESSKLEITYPKNMNMRVKTYNYPADAVVQEHKNSFTKTWQVSKLVPKQMEVLSVPWSEQTPSVFVAPVEFNMQKYNGNMSDWQSLGKFLYELNVNRDQLPPNIKTKVHELTDGLADPKQKIRALYQFMQKSTRYISVQLGIGGWQTFPATYVASKGYGDCKALTNYMYSLLKEAGIPSRHAVIHAGRNERSFREDFASNQFNHMILCIPMKDTMWLECTSPSSDMGYLGEFTSNRNALLLTPEGGALVKTPAYTAEENLQERDVVAKLAGNGNLTMHILTSYHGEQQDNIHMLTQYLSKEKISDYLKQYLSIPSYEINTFSYKQEPTALPSITEELDITGINYATITGKRIFLQANILNRTTMHLSDQSTRKYPLIIQSAYTDKDKITIELPEGYKPENIPQSVTLNTPFGSYRATYQLQEGKLIYSRYMQVKPGRYNPEEAPSFKTFYDAVYKADHEKLVLVKKEG